MSAAKEHAHLHHRPRAMHFYGLFQNAKVCCDVPVQATADDLVDAPANGLRGALAWRSLSSCRYLVKHWQPACQNLPPSAR